MAASTDLSGRADAVKQYRVQAPALSVSRTAHGNATATHTATAKRPEAQPQPLPKNRAAQREGSRGNLHSRDWT